MSRCTAIEALPDGTGGNLPTRVYRGGGACRVLHLHGGALAGQVADGLAAALAAAGATVFSIDYPCGPAHPFPAGLNAAYAALQALAVRRQALLVAGEEAGGTIAAALAMVCRDRLVPRLAGQILLSPMLDPRLGTCSARAEGAGPLGCKWADSWRDYLGTPDKASHPYAAPSSTVRLAGLPPALILTGAQDPMRDEAAAYAGGLRASGVPVTERLLAPETDPAAMRDAVAAFLAETLQPKQS